MSLFSGVRVGLDEVDPDETINIKFVRKKENGEDYEVNLGDLRPTNPFINSKEYKWGDDDDDELSTLTEYTQRTYPNASEISENFPPNANPNRRTRFGEEEFEENFPVVSEEDQMHINVPLNPADHPGRRTTRGGGSRIVVRAEDRQLNIRQFIRKELKMKQPRTKFKIIMKRTMYYINNFYRKVSRNLDPFHLAVERIEKTFGTGVASFYDLWKYVIWMNVGISIVMILFLLLPWLFRTDFSSSRKWGFIFEGNFYLGLLGFKSKVIGRTFFFYEGYGNVLVYRNGTELEECNYYESNVTLSNGTIVYCEESTPFTTRLLSVIPYEFRFFYPISIILYFLICLLVLVCSIGQRLRVVSKVDKTMKFSTGILSLWDHSVTGKSQIESMKKSIASAFLEYLQIEKQKEENLKEKTKSQIAELVIRRLVGWSVSIILLIGGPTIILVISNGDYYERLNSQFNFMTTIIFSVINISFPKILDWMVLLEKYSNARTVMYNRIMRKYILKITGLLSLIIRILTTYFWGNISENSNECIPVEAGIIIWQLIIVDFFTSFADNILSNYIDLMLARGVKKGEFNTSSAINRIIYRQSIIWLGTLFSPVLPILAVVSSTILFFARWAVMANTMRFPKKPVPNQMGNIFNQGLFLITLIICMAPTIVFFAYGEYGCGPAYEHSLAEGIAIWQLTANSELQRVFENVFQYVWIFFALGLLLAVILLYLVFQRYKMFEERYDDQIKKLNQERKLWANNMSNSKEL